MATPDSPPPEGAVLVFTLADRLRRSREHARLKQAELADDIGISRASVVNYEKGNAKPSRPVLLSWALRCGVSLNWLGGDEIPNRRGGVAAMVSKAGSSRGTGGITVRYSPAVAAAL